MSQESLEIILVELEEDLTMVEVARMQRHADDHGDRHTGVH